jgi:hypothetical protein
MERTMFDVSAQKDVGQREEEGTLVPVKSVTGEVQYDGEGDATKPVTIRVVGTYSKTYRRASFALRERVRKFRTTRTSEQQDQHAIELIADCLLGWEGITNGGQPFPFTRDNAIALLTNCPWVREDVEAAMGDHERFFSTSSAP